MYRKGGSMGMGGGGGGGRSIRANPGGQQNGSQEQQEPPPVPRARQQIFSQLDRLLLDLHFHFQRNRLGDSHNFQQFLRTQQPQLMQRIQTMARSSGRSVQQIISSSRELPQHLRNYYPQGSGHRSQDDLYADQSSIGTIPSSPSPPPSLMIQSAPSFQSNKSVPKGYDSAYYSSSQQSKKTSSSSQQGRGYQGGSSSTTGWSSSSTTGSISDPQIRAPRHHPSGDTSSSQQMTKRRQTTKSQGQGGGGGGGRGGGSISGYQGGASSNQQQQQDQSGRTKRRKS